MVTGPLSSASLPRACAVTDSDCPSRLPAVAELLTKEGEGWKGTVYFVQRYLRVQVSVNTLTTSSLI